MESSAMAALQNSGAQCRNKQTQENDCKRASGDGAPRTHRPDNRGAPVEILRASGPDVAVERSAREGGRPDVRDLGRRSLHALLSTKYSYDDDTDSSGFEFNYESDICDEEDMKNGAVVRVTRKWTGSASGTMAMLTSGETIGSGQLIMRTTMAAPS
ncbi:hypothetical protein PI124_g1857 [Phytophthora idaei]|nr:hypothetical protein PI125_g1574 [Phytophthora idaei]KAG3173279.1 hypothetical protein PI126_g924 [Phytophthora idaei]KAG3253577.1 hypothetical protein PI124_g1857 [Phytophthora idaei]